MNDMAFMQQEVKPAEASEKSWNYLQSLAQQRNTIAMEQELPEAWYNLFINFTNKEYTIENGRVKGAAQKDVSKFIDALKKCPPKERSAAVQSTSALMNSLKQDLVDGMYRGPEPNRHIYKVYHTVHGANVQVAKRLIKAAGDPVKGGHMMWKFKYEGRAPLHFLKPEMRMSMEEAMEFGRLYGSCCICGRTLTNELSIALGIGPICGGREFGGEFKFMLDQAKVSIENPDHDISKMSLEELEAHLAKLKNQIGDE